LLLVTFRVERALKAEPDVLKPGGMKMNRRHFLKATGLSMGTLSLAELGAEAAAAGQVSFIVQPSTMHIGLVTYNLAESWDIPTIIKNCAEAQFEGVELRTGHAHKVEVNLSPEQRGEVRKRFQDSKVQLMGLGSTFEYHTPDPAKLRQEMEATRQYILLAQDVGATGIKVRPNALPKEVPPEKTLAQIGRALGELGDFARDHGQVIRLEVHGTGTAFPPRIKTILDAANHPNVGACWNSNASDLDGEGWDYNFNLLKDKIFSVHMRDLFLEDYPFRKLMTGLNEIRFTGFCLAEIPASTDPVRVMKYYRALWLAYQRLL
jgi:sugar phosphate isomerase/epimerase